MSLPIYISDPAGRRYRSDKDYDYITTHMHQTVIDAVELAGYTAVKNAVPDMLETGEVSLEGYGGLILMGGFDIDSAFYTEGTRLSGFSFADIDMYELNLIYAAVSSGLPVLGICRGMQLINVAFGGSLYEDISHLTKLKHNNFGAGAYEHRALAHEVEVRNSSVLKSAVYSVASSHHQAVKKVGDTLTVTAWGEDGIIEMIENAELNVIGVQWHPEASHVEQSDTLSPLLDAFLKAVPEKVVYRTDHPLIQVELPPAPEPKRHEYTTGSYSSYFEDYGYDDDDEVPGVFDDRIISRHYFLDEDDYTLHDDFEDELLEQDEQDRAEYNRQLELRGFTELW